MHLYFPCVIYSWISWPLKMGPISCPETSITKYQFTLRKVPEKRKSHVYPSLHMSVYRLSAYLQRLINVSVSICKFFEVIFQRHTPRIDLFHGTVHAAYVSFIYLTLILLTWRIWWAPNNASKWQIGFNWTFIRLM